MNIFYSWQSNLEKKSNRSFIEGALHMAVADVEIDGERNLINVDRDTKDTSGAINIRDTILYKISQSQILVYDISIINNDDKDHKKCINSNVAFELGFGVCTLGWEKIILVFNTNCGDIEDVPFDIRGHRILSYNFDGSKNYKSNKMKELAKDLKNAIESIISNPNFTRNTGFMINDEEKKINHDYSELNNFFEKIHIPTFDATFNLINESNMLTYDIFHYFEGMKVLVNSVGFYFYDDVLLNKIQEFYKYTSKMLSYGNYFNSHNKFLKLTTNDTKIESNFREDTGLAIESMKKLLDYIKSNYSNIDFTETNKTALADRKKYQSMFKD